MRIWERERKERGGYEEAACPYVRVIVLIYIYIECRETKFIIPLYRENRKRSTLIIARVSNKYWSLCQNLYIGLLFVHFLFFPYHHYSFIADKFIFQDHSKSLQISLLYLKFTLQIILSLHNITIVILILSFISSMYRKNTQHRRERSFLSCGK